MTPQFIEHWFLPAFITFAFIMYSSAFAGYRIQQDAKKRGLSKASVTFWSVGTVFFGPIFLPLYLMFRARAVFAGGKGEEPAREAYRLCPNCGTENPLDRTTCKKCRRRFDTDKPMQGTKQCPYCGATNPVEGSRCTNCEQVIGLDDEE
jgi:ribosomal protein L40E